LPTLWSAAFGFRPARPLGGRPLPRRHPPTTHGLPSEKRCLAHLAQQTLLDAAEVVSAAIHGAHRIGSVATPGMASEPASRQA
jgi:hypothetical protein